VMLSARGPGSMRGIERVLAAILLTGAVGGAAAFARFAGTEPRPPGFELSASPHQHLTLPQTVVQIPTSVPTHLRSKPVAPALPRLHFATAVPADRAVGTAAAPPETSPAPATAPPAESPAPPPVAPAPAAPAPVAPAPVAPAPVAAPPERVLAAVQPDPGPPTTSPARRHGRGKAKGHDKQHGKGRDDDAAADPGPPAPPSEPADPAAPLPPQAAGEAGDAQGAPGQNPVLEQDQGDGQDQGHGQDHGRGQGPGHGRGPGD
jgi:hypothetical protein